MRFSNWKSGGWPFEKKAFAVCVCMYLCVCEEAEIGTEYSDFE